MNGIAADINQGTQSRFMRMRVTAAQEPKIIPSGVSSMALERPLDEIRTGLPAASAASSLLMPCPAKDHLKQAATSTSKSAMTSLSKPSGATPSYAQEANMYILLTDTLISRCALLLAASDAVKRTDYSEGYRAPPGSLRPVLVWLTRFPGGNGFSRSGATSALSTSSINRRLGGVVPYSPYL